MHSLKTIRILPVLVAFIISFGGVFAAEDALITIDQVLKSYSSVHDPLVVDDFAKTVEATHTLDALVSQWIKENPGSAEKAQLDAIEKGATKLLGGEDIDDARKAFIQISQGMIALIRSDKSLQAKWQLFFCPMVAKNQGFWVQPAGEQLANPYMGSAMPGCGSKKSW